MRALCVFLLCASLVAASPIVQMRSLVSDALLAINNGVRNATDDVLAIVARLESAAVPSLDELAMVQQAQNAADLFEKVFRDYASQRGVVVPVTLTTYDRFATPDAVPEHCADMRYGRLLVLRAVRLWVEAHERAHRALWGLQSPDRRLRALVKKLEGPARRICVKHHISGLFNALVALSSNDAMFIQSSTVRKQ